MRLFALFAGLVLWLLPWRPPIQRARLCFLRSPDLSISRKCKTISSMPPMSDWPLGRSSSDMISMFCTASSFTLEYFRQKIVDFIFTVTQEVLVMLRTAWGYFPCCRCNAKATTLVPGTASANLANAPSGLPKSRQFRRRSSALSASSWLPAFSCNAAARIFEPGSSSAIFVIAPSLPIILAALFPWARSLASCCSAYWCSTSMPSLTRGICSPIWVMKPWAPSGLRSLARSSASVLPALL
mmetsp:Transcript_54200/g.117121  ORF Transcript_54200/g.117121 Transcript_54200/m.117121 type:complete len:241 (-) Transcript_54200:262-984(-)